MNIRATNYMDLAVRRRSFLSAMIHLPDRRLFGGSSGPLGGAID